MGVATSGKMESPALIWLKSVHRRVDGMDTATVPCKAINYGAAQTYEVLSPKSLSENIRRDYKVFGA